jgi:hypothetical protein
MSPMRILVNMLSLVDFRYDGSCPPYLVYSNPREEPLYSQNPENIYSSRFAPGDTEIQT